MRYQFLAALALTLAASHAIAEEKPPIPLAELCQQVYCRAPDIRLRVGDGRVFEQRLDTPAPVLMPNGWMTVYPGETVYVEVEQQGDALKLLRAVPKLEKPATTLVLKFEQLAGKTDMMLTVTNPLSIVVRFDMGFMAMDSSRIRATSSCPVQAGLSLFEHWPHPIFQLVLAKPRVLAAGDDHSCK